MSLILILQVEYRYDYQNSLILIFLSVPARSVPTPAKIRLPKPNERIRPSPLRPDVPAADRLFAWKTSYSCMTSASTGLPSSITELASSSMRNTWAPATLTSYGAGIKKFILFCERHQVEEDFIMPASYLLLSAFIKEHSGTVSHLAIKNWMSGLKAWHDINHANWEGNDRWVELARTGAKKQGASFKRPKRAPVSLSHLHSLLANLDISTPKHAAIWAAACVAFFACRRLGEILVKADASFDPAYHVRKGTIISIRSVNSSSKSISFPIPWTKTTKEEGATVVITSRSDVLCPVKALLNHIQVNFDVPDGAPLFAYAIPEPPRWHHLNKIDFMRICGGIWTKANLPDVLGHSFRIGGAVALLLAGVPPEIVASTGGWTSLAFLLYWRRVEDILPLSTAEAYSKSDADRLLSILDKFRTSMNLSDNIES